MTSLTAMVSMSWRSSPMTGTINFEMLTSFIAGTKDCVLYACPFRRVRMSEETYSALSLPHTRPSWVMRPASKRSVSAIRVRTRASASSGSYCARGGACCWCDGVGGNEPEE